MTTNHKPSRNLQRILINLNDRALHHEGEPFTIKLTNNLRIDFRIKAGIASLLISRSSVFPSRVEWRTIRRHWPYKIDCSHQQVEKFVRGIGKLKSPIRHYLRCTWALQKDLSLGEKTEGLLQTDRPQCQPVDIDSGYEVCGPPIDFKHRG